MWEDLVSGVVIFTLVVAFGVTLSMIYHARYMVDMLRLRAITPFAWRCLWGVAAMTLMLFIYETVPL